MEKSDRATILTAVGAMLVPLAMVWALEAPQDLPSFFIYPASLIVAVVGIICILIGWNEIRLGESARFEQLEADKKQREKEEERRREEHIEYLTSLRIIAKQLGKNSIVMRHQVQREVERSREERELGDKL